MARPVTVLVLTPSIGGFYFGELLSGIGREVTAAGGRLVLVQTDGGEVAGGSNPIAGPVAWSHIDGVVAVTTAVPSSYLQGLRDAGKPIVLVSARLRDFAAPTAVPDNQGGTRAAVEHLIGHGHTRIGFVGNLAQPDVRDRYAGYRQALETHDLQADPLLLFRTSDNEWDGGATAARDVLQSAVPPTALMIATDRNAIGLMRALTQAGWVLPRDLAVIGFDNIEAAAFSSPTLSSVSQRFDDVGALAGQLLLTRIGGKDVARTPHVLASAQVELRGSCGCAVDALGNGSADDRPSHASAAELRTALTEALQTMLQTGDGAVDCHTREAVLAAIDRADTLLASRRDPAAAEIRALSDALRDLTSRPDVLRRVIRELTRYLRDVGAVEGTVPGRLELLTTALSQLQSATLHRQAELTEAALEEQFAVDAALLGAGGRDPCRLGWLAGTHVRTGVLALWEESSTSGGRLHVAGAYDADGFLPDLLGTTVSPEEFPPTSLIEAARISERRACIVVPVSSNGRDWGLLAVIGEVRPTTLEPYRHWASQLSAYLEQQTLQEAVRANEERYSLASQATNDGLWEWNVRNGDVFMSERCCSLLGLEAQPEVDRLAVWEARVHPDDRAEMRRCLGAVAIGQEQTGTCDYRVRGADGEYRWVLCKAIGVASLGGPVARVVGSMSDIHEQRCLEDQLRQNALHDELTGLPNRRLFLSQLDHAIELWARMQTPFAVIFLDLDRFKAVNDRLGHQAGDRVLSAVAARIHAELRAIDIGARFGGDEFAILLHAARGADVLDIARRVQTRLSEPIELDGHTLAVGASLGIATSASDYTDGEDVLRDADAAMYYAKDHERGTISIFEAGMSTRGSADRQHPGAL